MGLDGAKLVRQDKWARMLTILAMVMIGLSYGRTGDTLFLTLALVLLVVAAFVRYWGQSCFPFC